VLRYVERNPLRAKLVKEAEAWRWSSLWHRVHVTLRQFQRLLQAHVDPLHEFGRQMTDDATYELAVERY
jgi:hypothetical protein